jgi:general secretion pathway protein H
MLKSATGLSTERRRPGPTRAAGFSLIELLVVIVILGIMVSMVVLSMGTLRSDDPAETEARRLTALIEFISEEALLQGRDFGVEFLEDGYRFLSWDPDAQLWSVVDDEATLRRRTLPASLEVVLAVDGREVAIDSGRRGADRPQDELAPHVAIFSSGEFTPFELFLVTGFVADAWVLRGNMRGQLELIEPDAVQ